jgi:hypothetical protein
MHLSINWIRITIGLQTKESEIEKGFKCSTGDYWGFCDGNDKLNNSHSIVYEIEEGQQHARTNVLKYPPVLEDPEIKIILIQWLTKTPKSKNRWQLAKFVGTKMTLAFLTDSSIFFWNLKTRIIKSNYRN